LTELNEISKEMQELAKGVDQWRDTATILLVNELIIEITNLLLIHKLSTARSSLVKDEYIADYASNVRVTMEFIRETIRKNYKGISILSKTNSIKSNEKVVEQLGKAKGIIQESITLLNEEIQALNR
jgi:hypothetical protein